LSEYRFAFHEAQEITGIDWRLLAALAYQESKWDPLATSPTGVRGLMMLTEDTADRMGVTNRLDAAQSIRAGSKYLAFLMDELPPEIKQPDRLWFALAAYNLGMGHLNGARHFAPSLKRDPNSWVDMKQVLPLMSRPEYYERLKSGRARGGEAVILVENIRNYYDVLSRLEPIYTPPSLEKPKPIRKPKAKRKKASAPAA
jgi:membrane-bound lytic murein transglycosylase F